MIPLYLAASLPMIRLEDPPPMSMEAFQRQCSGLMTPEERSELERMLLGAREGFSTPFGRAWSALERQLENECASKRSQRPESLWSHSGYSVQVRDLVLEAFNRENPLERERLLDRGRFQLLEGLAAAYPYGLDRVLAFAGQLRLAHRWAGIQTEAGRKGFDALVEACVQSAAQEAQT